MVTIQIDSSKLSVKAPYHPDFPAKARSLGGKWDNVMWNFDARDETRVRALCMEIYGEDDASAADLVTARVHVNKSWWECNKGLYFAGRCIAYATGRDSGARLGGGVVVLNGKFSSGGSAKNWPLN